MGTLVNSYMSPGKILKDTLEDMSIICRIETETNQMDGSGNGSNSSGKPDGGDDGKRNPLFVSIAISLIV